MRTRIQMTSLLMLAAGILASSTAAAQTVVSTGPGYANEVYYSLENGTVRTEPLASWDIGFQVVGYSSSIITNGGAGVMLYHVPGKTADDWAETLDTTGMDESWDLWHNSPDTWDLGAFNMNSDYSTGNFGWGEYDMVTHIVSGTALYVIVLPDGAAKKIMIDGLSGGTYSFRYADLDGSNEVEASLAKSEFAGKNFGYYSIRDGKTVDHEPVAVDWDLVFGKYVAFLGPDMTVPYGVTGVRSNSGISAVRVKTGTPATAPVPNLEDFNSSITTIGYDWKSFTGTEYKVSDSLVFFVRKDVDGSIYRIVFTGFGGSSTGDFMFNQEVIGAASVNDERGGTVTAAVHPSVAGRGAMVDVVYSLDHAVSGARAVVHDLTGRVLSSVDLDGDAGLHRAALSAPETAGLYFVVIECGGRRVSQRLVVR